MKTFSMEELLGVGGVKQSKRTRARESVATDADATDSLPDKDKILEDLAEMGYSLNRFGNFERADEMTGTPVDAKDEILITRIYDHRQRMGKRAINKDRIRDILAEHAQSDLDGKYLKKVAETDFVAGTPNKIDEVCRAIAGPNFHRLYPVILNHVGYTIKRRMRSMPVVYPLLVNFSGPEECGKSYLVRRMFSAILPPGFMEELKDCGDVLGNIQKNGYLFTDRLGVVLGELSGMEQVSMDALKDLIDAEEIHYRRFFTQRSAKGPNRAQLIGTSNKHLREIFQRDEHIRKYCNIAFDECSRDERKNIRWPIVDAFDWSEWMRSINENGPSPLEPVYAEFKEWAKADCYRPTDTEVWLSGYIHRNLAQQRQFSDIWNRYKADDNIQAKAKLGRDNFQKLLLRYGCEKKITSGRSHYVLPSVITPLEGWDAYFGDEPPADCKNPIKWKLDQAWSE